MLAVLAALHMTAKRVCPADLDCGHHASLGEIDVGGIGSAPCLAMTAEDIGYFRLGRNARVLIATPAQGYCFTNRSDCSPISVWSPKLLSIPSEASRWS